MFMQIANPDSDDKLCSALAKAKYMAPEIIGLLHSAYHDGYRLAEGVPAERISEARRYAEKLLLAIAQAEQAIASAAPAAPANGIVPFPGNGAYSA